MRFDLGEDQRLFQETAGRFVERKMPVAAVRELLDDPDGWTRTWWREAAELGWTSLLVPEVCGGGSLSGSGIVDLALLAEEGGRGLSPGPLAPVNVVAETIGRVGTARQRRLLDGVLAGDIVFAWCFNEPGRGWTADDVHLDSTLADGGCRLTGVKTAVEAGAQADHLLVTTRSDGGLTQFLVERERPRLSVRPLAGLDITRRFAEVHFDGVLVGPDDVVGEAGGAGADVERQRLVVMALQCAGMVGAMARVFELTLQYAFDRHSFGRPLASYQALKHRFADMKLWLEASSAAADGAADALAADAPGAAEAVSVAKSYVGDRAVDLVQDCVQLHGGIGVTWEHDIHLYLRRVTVDRGLFGTPADHREQLAAAIAN